MQNPDNIAPQDIFDAQKLLKVPLIDFEGASSQGFIVVHQQLAADVELFFKRAYKIRFPITRVDLAQHPDFLWDDEKMMAANNSSGFNFRTIAGTDNPSLHGLGKAIDINPMQNPYISYDKKTGKVIRHIGNRWEPSTPGTFHAEHELVKLMESLGWEWGGHWLPSSGRTDYHHFQKPVYSN